MEKSWDYLRTLQGNLKGEDSSRCPRCGVPFDCRRGAISRRANVSICPSCGSKEAIEDFAAFKNPEFKPETVQDWYIVKIWTGQKPAVG